MKTTMPVSTPRQLLESEIERSADLKGLLAADRTDTAFMLVIVILLVLGFLARFCRRLEQVDRPPIRAHTPKQTVPGQGGDHRRPMVQH
jgi:hypothetical protein